MPTRIAQTFPLTGEIMRRSHCSCIALSHQIFSLEAFVFFPPDLYGVSAAAHGAVRLEPLSSGTGVSQWPQSVGKI